MVAKKTALRLDSNIDCIYGTQIKVLTTHSEQERPAILRADSTGRNSELENMSREWTTSEQVIFTVSVKEDGYSFQRRHGLFKGLNIFDLVKSNCLHKSTDLLSLSLLFFTYHIDLLTNVPDSISSWIDDITLTTLRQDQCKEFAQDQEIYKEMLHASLDC